MALDMEKSITLYDSSFRSFYKGEHHVNRLCKNSVLILMIDGVLRFGEDGVQTELKAGEYYVQRAGKVQDGNCASDCPRYFYVHFDATYTDGEGLLERGKWEIKQMMPLVEKLDKLQKSSASYLQKATAFFSILCELYDAQKAKPNAIAEQIRNELTVSLSDDIKIQDLASSLFVSVNYAIRVFKREYGVTPHKYLSMLRLDEARTLLRDTNRTEEEIAGFVGYSDFSVFYKAFKARFGVSPSAIRKR